MRRFHLIGLFLACLLPVNWASAQGSTDQVLEQIVLEYSQPMCRYAERIDWSDKDCSARPDHNLVECIKEELSWEFSDWEFPIILNQLRESNRHYEMVFSPEFEGRANEYIDKIYLDALFEISDFCLTFY